MSYNPAVRGTFITVEGPDGAGKSTLVSGLALRMTEAGMPPVVTREPGDGPAGPAIRAALLQGCDLDPWTEVFLFLADRRQHCEHVIRPALEARRVVLCDRFADSTVVYQGHARGLDIEKLRELNEIATGGLKPDVTLLLDVPTEVGLARLQSKDRLDSESEEFHRRVREGFLQEARVEPGRWHVLNGAATAEEVLEEAWNVVARTG